MAADRKAPKHEVVHAHRRSLAERCYSVWREAPASSDSARELFQAVCSCGAAGSIRKELHQSQVKIVSWTPHEIAMRDGAPCPAVAKAVEQEFPHTLEAQEPESLSVEDQQRLAGEFRAELRRRHEEINAELRQRGCP